MEKKTIKNTEFHSTFIFSVNFGTKTDLKHQVYIVQLTKSGKMPKLEKVPEAEAAAILPLPFKTRGFKYPFFHICSSAP